MFAGILCNPDAKRLYDDLLRKSGYNKLIRPVGNNTDKLTVKLGLRLSQLIDVVSSLMNRPLLEGGPLTFVHVPHLQDCTDLIHTTVFHCSRRVGPTTLLAKVRMSICRIGILFIEICS